MMGRPQLCTFHVGDLLFGVPVSDVQEVIRHQPMTPVPLSPGAVRGLINLRGQIVTAIDLRDLLDMPPMDADAEPPMNVVTHTAEGPISLLADSIGDVIEVDTTTREPATEQLRERLGHLVSTIYKLPDRVLLLLDVARTLDLIGAERAA